MSTRRSQAFFLLLVVPALLVSGCSAPAPASSSASQPTPGPQPAVTEVPAATAELAPTAGTSEQPAPTLAPASQPTSVAPALTATPQAAQGSTPSGAPADVIWNAEEKQLQQAYRADEVLTTSGSATSGMTFTIEYAPPGHVDMSGPGGMETIILYDQGAVYEKGPGGGWTQLPAAEVQTAMRSMPSLDPKQVDQLKQQIIADKTRFVGPDVVNGTPAWVYDYATTLPAEQSVGLTSRIWIGMANGLPLKVQSTSNAPTGGGKDTVLITYQYDPNIKVQAPQ